MTSRKNGLDLLVHRFDREGLPPRRRMSKMQLKFAKLARALAQFPQNRCSLGEEELGVVSHQDCPFGSEDMLVGSPRQHATQIFALQRVESGLRDAEQIGMLDRR